jgi:hypothetical protein
MFPTVTLSCTVHTHLTLPAHNSQCHNDLHTLYCLPIQFPTTIQINLLLWTVDVKQTQCYLHHSKGRNRNRHTYKTDLDNNDHQAPCGPTAAHPHRLLPNGRYITTKLLTFLQLHVTGQHWTAYYGQIEATRTALRLSNLQQGNFERAVIVWLTGCATISGISRHCDIGRSQTLQALMCRLQVKQNTSCTAVDTGTVGLQGANMPTHWLKWVPKLYKRVLQKHPTALLS